MKYAVGVNVSKSFSNLTDDIFALFWIGFIFLYERSQSSVFTEIENNGQLLFIVIEKELMNLNDVGVLERSMSGCLSFDLVFVVLSDFDGFDGEGLLIDSRFDQVNETEFSVAKSFDDGVLTDFGHVHFWDFDVKD